MDYLPYGKVLREYVPSGPEKFLTTGHERDVETGLDYRGARFYDADVARFLSLDPLAADFADVSAYNYVLGNPVSLVDPDGKAPEPPKSRMVVRVELKYNYDADNKVHTITRERTVSRIEISRYPFPYFGQHVSEQITTKLNTRGEVTGSTKSTILIENYGSRGGGSVEARAMSDVDEESLPQETKDIIAGINEAIDDGELTPVTRGNEVISDVSTGVGLVGAFSRTAKGAGVAAGITIGKFINSKRDQSFEIELADEVKEYYGDDFWSREKFEKYIDYKIPNRKKKK